ncbi:lysostaphin resistance A-like protein [Haliscomenobacter sp.]|uniref:CPBP family intramembrane glutamic endopeptidase n=1 Tax=Haliscomenobacter sp. TaxID=2717303 RepID=UPI003592F44A
MDYPLPDSESPAKSQEASPWIVLLCLVAFMLVGLILGSMLINALLLAQGLDGLSFLGNMKEDASLQQRNLARWANLFPHLFAFTGGALAVALIFFRRSWLQKLQLRHWPNWMFIAAGVLFVLAIFPVAQTSYWLNQQLPLPMWMKDMEKSANELVKVLLHMDSPAELLLNLLTVGVVAALGEELVFRGIVQQQMNKVFKNPILSIWITAIIFSAIHMQFVGFLPRMILGAGLGYLFYWSRSLWLPILVHFLFNSLQVVAYYFLGEKAEQFSPDQAIDSPNWLGGTLGLVILIVVGYYMSRLHKQQNS